MISFETTIIDSTVQKLLLGEDYREEIVNAINVFFLDFTVDFFKKIVDAKIRSKTIDLSWYKEEFIDNSLLSTDERAIYAGMNRKTINNIYGTTAKKVVLNAANINFEYLSEMVKQLEDENNSDLNITLKICYKEVSVDLNLSESLLVINALATKKIALRGGAWSSIGKKVEKPLVTKMCGLCGVPREFIDNSIFKKDGTLDYDREVDYKILSKEGNKYRVEVKLMGKGNPESADVVIARDTNILIADTLSEQNKKQIKSLGIEYLELKNNKNIISDFKKILKKLNVPYAEEI